MGRNRTWLWAEPLVVAAGDMANERIGKAGVDECWCELCGRGDPERLNGVEQRVWEGHARSETVI